MYVRRKHDQVDQFYKSYKGNGTGALIKDLLLTIGMRNCRTDAVRRWLYY